ncbi:endonuclease/Exonuclease/phosphatase family domain-containing protein [Ditylenchus destructor]|uniref:Endonuclease/Exonuclease/phosphatase family domain-containing protein n=1 Tax=Ditylenchus destructor TaxID=166010 RepID=A0AAD4NHR9_9BILA|nr:endonuclease/Exonuclease/phosphatase family domain-containing protein [Ditylenchus destructor]
MKFLPSITPIFAVLACFDVGMCSPSPIIYELTVTGQLLPGTRLDLHSSRRIVKQEDPLPEPLAVITSNSTNAINYHGRVFVADNDPKQFFLLFSENEERLPVSCDSATRKCQANLGKRAPGRRVFVNPNKPIKIFITTFNAGGAFPTPDHMRAWIGRNWIGSGKPDLFVIALQEIIELNVGNMLNKDAAKARKKEWLIVLQKVLPYGYDLIRSVRMFGLFLAVYHRPSFGVRVSEVYDDKVRRGIVNKVGNKGAVAISMLLNGSITVCFVNSHLSAGSSLENLKERNNDVKAIIEELKFKKNMRLDDHQNVFWAGDLNYRLNGSASYDEVVHYCTVTKDCHRRFLIYDELGNQKKTGVFMKYNEDTIEFRATYKFNVNTSRYDTSEKRRIPAWCDRVLYKTSMNKTRARLIQTTYESIEEVESSDHKPVRATFEIQSTVKRARYWQPPLQRQQRVQRRSMGRHTILRGYSIPYQNPLLDHHFSDINDSWQSTDTEDDIS